MQNKLSFLIALLITCASVTAQKADSLIIHYYENYPYAYVEAGKLKGIEIDILEEYVSWLKQKKNTNVVVKYQPYKEFSAFYNSVKEASPKVIGLGSITMNAEREHDVLFSPPYLQNVAVLITSGSVPTVKGKAFTFVSKDFAGLSAIAVNKSSHLAYLTGLKGSFLPDLKINITESQTKVLDAIVNDKTVFGYADIVAYWSYLKLNPTKFLKIQKVFNEPRESLAFALPKNSIYSASISEFFESGFGFTSTKTYHQILEKYLGYEIIDSVELK